MKLDVSLLKSVLNLYNELQNNGISLVYMGEFSHEITKMFTSMAEEDLDRQSEQVSVRKRVYHVIVETLQNMNKHSDELGRDEDVGKGLYMVGKKDECYYVITSNLVSNNKKESLEEALEEINAASHEELREMYKKQIKEGSISEKGGAGLGLIDIARKTTGKHDYQFIPFDEDYFLFILKVEIHTNRMRRAMEQAIEDKKEAGEEKE